MNRLRKNIRLLIYGQFCALGSILGLGILRLVQVAAGIEERDFYRRYPTGRWIAASLGLLFIGALIYSVKKVMDVHPNIQLRKQPDEELHRVLADPDYALWHNEARRLLAARQKKT